MRIDYKQQLEEEFQSFYRVVSQADINIQYVSITLFDIFIRFSLNGHMEQYRFARLNSDWTPCIKKTNDPFEDYVFNILCSFFDKEKEVEKDKILEGKLKELSRILKKSHVMLFTILIR